MLINNLPIIMIRCLFFTIVIEFIIAKIMRVKNKKDLLNVVLVNMITNPIVVIIPVLVNIYFGLFERNVTLYILEIITVIFEGIMYKKYLEFKNINPFLISFILNTSSYLIGEIINYIIF